MHPREPGTAYRNYFDICNEDHIEIDPTLLGGLNSDGNLDPANSVDLDGYDPREVLVNVGKLQVTGSVRVHSLSIENRVMEASRKKESALTRWLGASTMPNNSAGLYYSDFACADFPFEEDQNWLRVNVDGQKVLDAIKQSLESPGKNSPTLIAANPGRAYIATINYGIIESIYQAVKERPHTRSFHKALYYRPFLVSC